MEKFNGDWGGMLKEEPERPKQEAKEKIEKESALELPNSIEGEIKGKEGEKVIISTEFGELKIPEDKFKSLFPDKTEGKVILTSVDPEELPEKVLNELLSSDNNEGDENN